MRGALLLWALLGAAPATAQAVAPQSSDFVYVTELLERGFEPFGTGGGQTLFGMTDGSIIYMCFSADTEALADQRRDVLLGAIGEGSEDRALPNLPVACILTQ